MEEVELDELGLLTPQETNKREYVWSLMKEYKTVDTRNILNTFARLPQFLTLDSAILREVIVRMDGGVVHIDSEVLEEIHWLYERLYEQARVK